MAATASAPPPLSPSAAGGVDQEGSNVSSPLSDVDDKDSNDADMEQLHLDGDDGEDSSLSAAEDGRQVNRDGSDSDSVLSEANSDINSDMNDTEAETERLYDTPETQRQRDVLLDRYNDGQVFEHTPSRLRMTKTMNDDDNGGNDESGSSDNASVAPGRANRIKTLGQLSSTKHTGVDEETQGESQERKRKRSAVADQSDSDQPLRKRTGSVGAPGGVADDDAVMNEEDITPHPDHLDNRSGDEDADSSTRKQRELAEDGATLRETRMSKKVTLSGSKHKGAAADDVDEEADREAHDETRDATIEEDVEQADEEVEAEADAEEEADTAAKNLEELERKQAALKDWTHIEEMFGVFRDRLYKDRLQRLEEEEQSLLADVPTHPEYLNMKQCIDDRLNKKLEEIDTEYEFRIKAHERRAVAQRAQIWSQYFQAVRERREKALELLNKEWYEVQAARRSAHSLPDYGLLFPKEPTFRLRNAIAFNSEVSTLAGVAKYEGFPAAPNMTGASIAEVQDDLNAIEQARRGRHKQSVVQSRDDYQTSTFHRLGPAGEQFLKDTPWANPNHSAHKSYQAAVAQSGDALDHPTAAAKPVQQGVSLPGPGQTKAAPEGPHIVQRSPALSARQPESPELTRSMLNSAAHQMKRANNLPTMARGSKTAAA